MIQSYLAGNPVTYSASDDYDIEAVKDAYFEQDISGLDSEIVKHMSVFGRAYELIYMDETLEFKECNFRSVRYICSIRQHRTAQ